jgi:predicted TIM-barrel fold metal-dependent hydrolase
VTSGVHLASDHRPIVDAAVHIWAPEDPADPWPPGSVRAAATHRSALSASELLELMSGAGVDRAVVFPPFFTGFRNRYTIEQAAAHPDRLRAMPRIDLRHDRAEWQLAGVLDSPGVSGIRLIFTAASGVRLDETADWLWPIAERDGIPVMLLAPRQHDQVRAIAERHPGLRLALDHLNLSGETKDAAIADEIDELVKLATLPNVSVKMTAVPCYSTEPFPYPTLHTHLRRTFDAFGPDRVFWGSDLTRLRGSYEDLVKLFVEELDFLQADLPRVMGASLNDWIGWDQEITTAASGGEQ